MNNPYLDSFFEPLFDTISSTIKGWVDVTNGELPEGDKNFGFLEADIVDSWLTQTMKLYEAVTADRDWNKTKHTHFENIWEEIKTRRNLMLESNKIRLRLSFKSNSQVVAWTNPLNTQKARLDSSLRKDFLSVGKLLGVPGLEDTWDWTPQAPERLTVTQFKRLPKH